MGEVILSVKDIRKRIKKQLEEKLPDKCVSICKVPMVLTEKNREAYIPKWVSLGPYHHNASHLSSDMYAHKERGLLRMMARLSAHRPNMSTFDEIVREVQNSESKIRNSYEMDIKCNGERLACMMVLDGCFVLEILRCLSDQTSNDDAFFNRHNIEYASYTLLTDILLLENQIPLFILIKLLKYEMETDLEAKRKLAKMLISDHEVGRLFYPFIFEREEWSRQVQALITDKEPAHLLDLTLRLVRGDLSTQAEEETTERNGKYLCKLCFNILCKLCFNVLCKLCFNILCKKRKKELKKDDSFSIPTATELYDAGIKFEACEGGLKRVCFNEEKNTLQLPKINVTASVGIFLRNLMAYEICETPKKRIISNFAVWMDELINTERDVALLRRNGIIHSYTLGSDKDVASFFNDLRKGAAGAGSSSMDTFREQRKKLLKCYHRKYRVMFAEFVKLHFSKPWRTIQVLAAAALLIMSLLQTVYTIMGYYSP